MKTPTLSKEAEPTVKSILSSFVEYVTACNKENHCPNIDPWAGSLVTKEEKQSAIKTTLERVEGIVTTTDREERRQALVTLKKELLGERSNANTK